MATITDDFNSYTDGDPLGGEAAWVYVTDRGAADSLAGSAGSGVPTLDTHDDHSDGTLVVDCSNNGGGYLIHQTPTDGPDQDVSVETFGDRYEIETRNGYENLLGVLLRWQGPSSTSGYGCILAVGKNGDGNLRPVSPQIVRYDSKTPTVLATGPDLSLDVPYDYVSSNTHVVRGVIEGDIITMYVEGFEVASYDISGDGTKYDTGNYHGARLRRDVASINSQPFLDNYAAEDVAGGGDDRSAGGTSGLVLDASGTATKVSAAVGASGLVLDASGATTAAENKTATGVAVLLLGASGGAMKGVDVAGAASVVLGATGTASKDAAVTGASGLVLDASGTTGVTESKTATGSVSLTFEVNGEASKTSEVDGSASIILDLTADGSKASATVADVLLLLASTGSAVKSSATIGTTGLILEASGTTGEYEPNPDRTLIITDTDRTLRVQPHDRIIVVPPSDRRFVWH